MNDSLDFVEQLVEIDTVCNSDFVEVDLAVDSLNDSDFEFALVGYGTNSEVFGSVDFVILNVCADEFYKLFAVSFGLAHADARNIGQFLDSDRVCCCHSLERGVLEDNKWWQVEACCYLSP